MPPTIKFRRTNLVKGGTHNPVSAVEIDGTVYGYIVKFREANQRGGTDPEWRWYDDEETLHFRQHSGTRLDVARFYLRRLHNIEVPR